MQRTQLNDLFQFSLIFGVGALFAFALIGDLRNPAGHQDQTISAAQLAQATQQHQG